jgi:hypothetical protein
VNPDRLRLEWVSASEGIRFANIMNEFGRQSEKMGALGKSEGIDENTLKFKLKALENILPYIKLVGRERLRVSIDTIEAYNTFYTSDEADRIIQEMIVDKLAVSEIMLLLREKPLTSREISDTLNLNSTDVAGHLTNSVRQGLVRFDENQKVLLPPKMKEQARV